MARNNIIVGLDIGTTKICTIVGEPTQEGDIKIIGIGTHPSHGLKKGVVINIESTVESISKAVEDAERMAGVQISNVLTGIAGGHIQSFNSSGVVAVRDEEITDDDVDRVIEAAKAVAVPMDREIIHVIPQEYKVDEQDGIKEPVGMSGVRLEAKVHIVTAALSSAQNIVKCANRAGLQVTDVVLQPIASSNAVLHPDEKELGCLLIDVGGGTSDYAIFTGGALIHTGVVPIGGNHLTGDVAMGLRTPQREAEKLKRKYGSALASMVSPGETIEVPSVGGRNPRVVSRELLAQILEPRCEEIFTQVKEHVAYSGFESLLAGGVIITGGGTLLPGMLEMAEFVFDMPVKRGNPSGKFTGMADAIQSPKYATGVGLVSYGYENMMDSRFSTSFRIDSNLFANLKTRMGSFFTGLFN